MDNRYFKRDISWLSFNYRVLLEAEDETLPLYERINFISIYSSNLEEFYNHIHRSILEKESHRNPYSVAVIYSYLYNKESTKKSIANWRNVSASTNRRYCPPCGNITSYSIKAAT